MTRLLKPFFILIFMLSITSCNFSKNKEIEPNNTFTNATPAFPDKEYTGTIESEKDIDNFLLTVKDTTNLRIELSGIKGINNAFTVYRINGSSSLLLKVVDDNRKSSQEELADIHVSPGTYIISVHHGERDEKKGNPESWYILKISSDSASIESEPNDNASNSNTISFDGTIKGYYSPAKNPYNESQAAKFREEDWYSFEVTADENNPAIVNINLSGVPGVDSVLELYDSSGNRFDQSDTGGPGYGESFNGYGLQKSGVYYIVVASKNLQFNHKDTYALSLTSDVHEQGSELEPNNTFDQALKLSSTGITGKINSSGDNDYYMLDPSEKMNYRIELTGDENTDVTLTVFSSARKKLFEINNSGAGEVEVIPNLQVKEQTYLLVTSSSKTESEAGYKLIASPLDSVVAVEFEPNNSKAEAAVITDKIRGYTTTVNDTDYYMVKNDSRKNYRIQISAPLNGAIKISTTDQQGYIIKTKELKKGESVNFNEIYEKKGYIIIETVTADFDNYYELSIEEIL